MITLSNNYKAFVMAAACIIGLGSCSNDDYLGGHYTTDGMGTLMNVKATIQASTNPSLAWTEGNIIGIATSYGQYDATAKNREYVCQADGTTFTCVSENPIYVKGNTDIVAYYPFTGADCAETVLTLDTRDQDNITNYLLAKVEGVSPANGSQVNLVFDYALSQLTMDISTLVGETITGYRLQGFSQVATIDPFTQELTYETPEDLVGTGTNITNLTLKLIPQAVSADASITPRLILIGSTRSYSIDMSGVSLTAGVVSTASIDVTDGIGNIEFVPGGGQWTDSGVGDNVTSSN